MATYAKSELARCMATADYLIPFEATVNAPVAPTLTLSACKIRCDHFNFSWQTAVAAGENAAGTKSILQSKYYPTYSIYEMFSAQLVEQIQQGSSEIPQASVPPLQNSKSAPSYRHRGFFWRLSSLADFP